MNPRARCTTPLARSECVDDLGRPHRRAAALHTFARVPPATDRSAARASAPGRPPPPIGEPLHRAGRVVVAGEVQLAPTATSPRVGADRLPARSPPSQRVGDAQHQRCGRLRDALRLSRSLRDGIDRARAAGVRAPGCSLTERRWWRIPRRGGPLKARAVSTPERLASISLVPRSGLVEKVLLLRRVVVVEFR
jgi:hypothetical protein